MPGGRPTDYTEELAQEICDKVASRGAGLATFCSENPHWPHRDTIYLWLRKYPTFSDNYAKAKKDQVNALADEILAISDDSSRDSIVKEDKDGNEYEVFNTEFAARSRLRVDTRKWIAAKLVPRLYGDNAGMRELYEEIAELRRELAAKGVAKDGGVNNSEKEQDSEV
jgi:hypothetical protein